MLDKEKIISEILLLISKENITCAEAVNVLDDAINQIGESIFKVSSPLEEAHKS